MKKIQIELKWSFLATYSIISTCPKIIFSLQFKENHSILFKLFSVHQENEFLLPNFDPSFLVSSSHNPQNKSWRSFCDMAPGNTISKRTIHSYLTYCPDIMKMLVSDPFLALVF